MEKKKKIKTASMGSLEREIVIWKKGIFRIKVNAIINRKFYNII